MPEEISRSSQSCNYHQLTHSPVTHMETKKTRVDLCWTTFIESTINVVPVPIPEVSSSIGNPILDIVIQAEIMNEFDSLTC